MRIKKIISIMLSAIICISLCSCKKRNEGRSKEKGLNLYVDIKDKNSLSIIKFLIEEYTKRNPKSKLNINDVLGGENSIVEDISKGKEADVVITSRNTMIELSQKGLLGDMSQYYERNKIGEKNYNIMSSYGRVMDKYYGIGVVPYTMEIFYNTDALSKLGEKVPENISNLLALAKKLKDKNIRIPVVVPEDLDINLALSSIAASNKVKLSDLDNAYENKKAYKEIKEMQSVFNDINIVKNKAKIDKNSFEIGNESTFTSMKNGSVPIVISTSYYYNNLKEGNIDLVKNLQGANNTKFNMPVIVNTLLCVPTNGKNTEEAGKFIKFILEESTQEKLVKKGHISGSKKANAELQGIGEDIVKHLSNANDNSILYIYSLPKKFQRPISAKIDSILAGKYSKKEWEEILDEVYK